MPFYSTVTGARVDHAAFDGAYWYTNLRQTVRMEEATRALLAALFSGDSFVAVSSDSISFRGSSVKNRRYFPASRSSTLIQYW